MRGIVERASTEVSEVWGRELREVRQVEVGVVR